MSRPSSRTTRTSRLAAAVIGGALLAVAVPSIASAHVTVSPDELVAGDHGVLTFAFSHGCENSPTTALRITMPDGLASVAPTMDGDWNIAVERGDDGLISAVTYTALAPVPTDLRGAVSMSVGLDEDTPETLAFPVEQKCVEGTTEWNELAAKGEDPHSLDAPAPVVSVVAGAADGHGTHRDAEPSAEASEESAQSSPWSTVLGAGGLVAGLAALVVSILAYRRRS
ncbi:MAG: YcnI family protein [Candidatus Microbacterium colombiense]|nr:MAG: YcnI family protein [Microbacterium sp.]